MNNQSTPNSGDSPLLMPEGSCYAGQPIDLSSRRSIAIRAHGNKAGNEDALIDPRDVRVVVDDFYHDDEFWSAVIPLDGVADVFGQSFNFSKIRSKQGPNGRETIVDKRGLPKRWLPILNHVQCRFTLRPGFHVDLYPMGGDPASEPLGSEPADRIQDFVYSAEAVGPLGVSFNLRDGLAGNLLNAHRFISTREMVFERIVVENQYVTESPALPITKSAKRDLLVRALLRSHQAGLTEAYYLYRLCGTNNCTSNPFTILDRVVDYSLAGRIGSTLYRLPLSPRFYLRVRGLDADPSVRKLVRTEFDEYIHDPATRQRKRHYVRQHVRARRAARAAATRRAASRHDA